VAWPVRVVPLERLEPLVRLDGLVRLVLIQEEPLLVHAEPRVQLDPLEVAEVLDLLVDLDPLDAGDRPVPQAAPVERALWAVESNQSTPLVQNTSSLSPARM
jgi:hypothetical protein